MPASALCFATVSGILLAQFATKHAPYLSTTGLFALTLRECVPRRSINPPVTHGGDREKAYTYVRINVDSPVRMLGCIAKNGS